MTAALSFWGVAYWQWLSADQASWALFWARMFSVGSLFIPLLYYQWVLNLLEKEVRFRYIIRLGYILCFTFTALSWSTLLVKNVEARLFFPFWPNPGILYTIYILLIYFGLISHALFLLHKNYYQLERNKRGQIFYIALGTIFGFGGGLTNFFLWYNIPIPPYGNFLVAIFPFFLAYSTLKFGLFNIKTISTELFTFSLWIFISIRVITSATPEDRIANGILLTLTVIVGIFLIRSVYREVESREKIEKLAEDLERANMQLKELDQQKSEFVSIASHQLRSPLTAIKGYSSMLLEGSFGKMNKNVTKAVSTVFDSSESLVRVIDNFLNLSRIEQRRMVYDPTPTDLALLTKSIVDQLLPNIEKKGLKISFKAADKADFMKNVDKDKTRQVILNMIDNAIKYTPQGSIWIDAQKKKDGKVIITVSDTGIGMSKETIEKLFKKFSRAEGASKVNAGGTGLGMYLASEIMRAQGGTVRAESDGVGKGSRFIIEFA